MQELINEINIKILQNTQPHTETGPRIAALEADGTAEAVVAQFNQPNHQQKEQEAQAEGVYYARRSIHPNLGLQKTKNKYHSSCPAN